MKHESTPKHSPVGGKEGAKSRERHGVSSSNSIFRYRGKVEPRGENRKVVFSSSDNRGFSLTD